MNGEAELAFFLDLVASLQYKQFLAEQKFVVGKLAWNKDLSINICNLSNNFCITDLSQFRAGWLCNASTIASSQLYGSVTGNKAVVEQSLVTQQYAS